MPSQQKSPRKMGLKRYLMNKSSPFSVFFFGILADIFLVREAIVVISKETGGWLLPKQVLIIAKSVKTKLSPTPSETFCNGLDFELCEIQGITFIVFEQIKLIGKKKS